MNKKDYFLPLVKKNSRNLYVFIIAFAAIWFVSNLIPLETTPFFVFGLYSDKFEPSEEYVYLDILIDGESYNPTQLTNLQKTRILTPLSYYYKHVKNEGDDPLNDFIRDKSEGFYQSSFYNHFKPYVTNDLNAQKAFVPWFIQYFKSSTNLQFECLEVDLLYFEYHTDSILLKRTEKLIGCE